MLQMCGVWFLFRHHQENQTPMSNVSCGKVCLFWRPPFHQVCEKDRRRMPASTQGMSVGRNGRYVHQTSLFRLQFSQDRLQTMLETCVEKENVEAPQNDCVFTTCEKCETLFDNTFVKKHVHCLSDDVDCLNGCGVTIQRWFQTIHDSSCPDKPVKCLLFEVCRNFTKRKDWSVHFNECVVSNEDKIIHMFEHVKTDTAVVCINVRKCLEWNGFPLQIITGQSAPFRIQNRFEFVLNYSWQKSNDFINIWIQSKNMPVPWDLEELNHHLKMFNVATTLMNQHDGDHLQVEMVRSKMEIKQFGPRGLETQYIVVFMKDKFIKLKFASFNKTSKTCFVQEQDERRLLNFYFVFQTMTNLVHWMFLSKKLNTVVFQALLLELCRTL